MLIWIGVILLRSLSPAYSTATWRLLGVAYLISGLLLLIAVVRGQVIGYSLIELALELFSALVVIQMFGLLGHYLSIPGPRRSTLTIFVTKGKRAGKESLRAVEPGTKH